MRKKFIGVGLLLLLASCGNTAKEPNDSTPIAGKGAIGHLTLRLNEQDQAYSATIKTSLGDIKFLSPVETDLNIDGVSLVLSDATSIPNEFLNEVKNKKISKYTISGDGLEGNLGIKINPPISSNYDFAYIYQYVNGKLVESNESYPDTLNISFLSSPTPRRNLEFYRVEFNLEDLRNVCQKSGKYFAQVSCIDKGTVDEKLSAQGATDNKLVALSMNVGNVLGGALCGGLYNVKLCELSDEDKVLNTVSSLYPDLILFQEVFNNDCRDRNGNLIATDPSTICGRVTGRQIDRILPKSTNGSQLYTSRCSPRYATERLPNGQFGYISGYECIAVKNGFLNFDDTTQYLGVMSPNCSTNEADGILNPAGMQPLASPGRFVGQDTGSYFAKIRANGYSQTFYAITAHLVAPPDDRCRAEQLEFFSSWQRNAQIKFIYAGDYNTDPWRDLVPGDLGRQRLNQYFLTSEQSTNINYDRNSLVNTGRLGFRLSNDRNETALYGPVPASLDHVHTNFARPYYNGNSNDCSTGNAGTKIDFDHEYTLCALNISNIK